MSLSYSSILAEKEPERVNDGSMEEQLDDQNAKTGAAIVFHTT